MVSSGTFLPFAIFRDMFLFASKPKSGIKSDRKIISKISRFSAKLITLFFVNWDKQNVYTQYVFTLIIDSKLY